MAFFNFYFSNDADSLQARVYGNKRRVFNGGVKPTNKLGQQFSVLIPQKPPKRTVDKAFDLTHGLQSSNLLAQPHQANKRQRTNGRASESTPSSPPSRPIDVEDSTPRKSQTNTALSKTRRGGRKDGNISEYSSVEDTVNPRKGTSGINPITSAYFQLPVSMKHSKPDEDNDDPISDSDMTPDRRNWKKEKISRLPSPTYKGTGNPTIARRLPPGNGQRSSNSKLLLRHQDDMNKKPSAQPAKRKHSVGSADELAAGHEGKKNTSKKENSEAAEAAVLLNAVQGDVNGVVHLDDTDDEKVGKKADIPSISKKPKRPAKKAGGITFQVTEAFSTVAPYKMKPGDRWFFICYTDAEVCRLIDGDGEVKDEVLVASILAVQWSKDSAKMSLPRRVDGNTKRQSTIFLELGSNDESADLVEQLCKLSPTLPLTPSPAEQLDKVFSYQRGKTFQYKQNQPRPPADITVLEKKAETRQAQRRAQEQDLKQRGSTKLTASQQPPQVIEPQRAEGLRRRMGNSANGDTIAPNDFYNKSSNHGADHSPPLLARRNPARNRKEIGYQERIRSPTPPPVARWTVDNPGWEERWLDTIVYPPGPGHKRTATVDLGDIERLDDEQFLNDSVVNFYLRYLEYELEQSRPEVAKRMYFQNSFFYERLTTPAANGKKGIDYKAVQRWTKGVDLFSKDYIIVPVCENLHWYVAIICNAPALLKSDVVDDTVETKTPAEPNTEPKEDAPAPHTSPVNLEDDGDLMKMDSLQTSFKECLDLEKPAVESPESHHQIVQEPHETNPLNSSPIANIVSDLEPNKAEKPITTKSSRKPPTDRSLDPNTPRIIILDSLGGGHLVTSKNLRDYLVDEMKDKHGKDVNPPRQMHFAAKNLDVQKNYSDCGLFLLSYIQKFLESPDDFISGILRHERVPSWINPSVLRKDIREHLFNLQRQSPKKPKRGSRAVLPKLAPRPTQTEPLPSPPGRTAEEKSSSNGVALPPTNACTNTTDNPKIITRSLKPAAPGEASAQMTKPTASRNHRGANGTAAKEVVDLANGTDSERTPAENSRLPASSSSKGPTHSRPTDEDHSSTLHDLTGSSQVVIQKKPEHGAKKNTFVGTMIESVNGFMGLGQAAGGKDDAKDLGNSVSSPVEIPDSPAKSDIRRENNQQKSRRRRPSVEEVSPSKRQRSSPSGPRDFFSRYPSAKFDDNEILEDEVPEPPSPGLHNPNFGQKASELSSVRTIRKNGSQSPDDQNGDDREMLLLSQATNACTSAKKSSSPSPVNIQKQRTPSPMLDLSNMREDNEEESAAPVSPGFEVGSGHPRSQKSLQGGLGTHTHF